MSAKKIPIFISENNLELLKLIQGKHGDAELGISSAVNLCIQFGRLAINQHKPHFTTAELLYCCDVCNPGATMTEFDTPDSVSIERAISSMLFGIIDNVQCNYGQENEKWDINPAQFLEKLVALQSNLSTLFVLALATRHFWNGAPFSDFKSLVDCENFHEWAAQWISDDGKPTN